MKPNLPNLLSDLLNHTALQPSAQKTQNACTAQFVLTGMGTTYTLNPPTRLSATMTERSSSGPLACRFAAKAATDVAASFCGYTAKTAGANLGWSFRHTKGRYSPPLKSTE
jgi:hypothetical protein